MYRHSRMIRDATNVRRNVLCGHSLYWDATLRRFLLPFTLRSLFLSLHIGVSLYLLCSPSPDGTTVKSEQRDSICQCRPASDEYGGYSSAHLVQTGRAAVNKTHTVKTLRVVYRGTFTPSTVPMFHFQWSESISSNSTQWRRWTFDP